MPWVASHISPCSGSWYPGDPTELENLLDELLESSVRRTGSYLFPRGAAFVVPHAGLAYSGRMAAAVYRHVGREQPRRVVLLGFSHHGAPPGLWIPEVEAFETPLGKVAVDREAVEQLLTSPVFGGMPEERLCDHSVEIQLPLLQKAAPSAAVVPIYVSAVTPPVRTEAAAALAELMKPGAVVLASSDFTHYGDAFHYKPFPHDRQTRTRLHLMDEEFIEAAGSLHPDLFLDTLEAESATVCGREPIALLLAALRSLPAGEDIFQQTLDYETSGDITGDFAHSVSYAALGYFPFRSFCLGEEEQKLLLESARQTLRHYQETGMSEAIRPEHATGALQQPGSAFVTLRQQGRLRGCIGRCVASEPLATAVPELTLAAALEDTRFEPLSPSERDIDIEISVLSPMKRIADTSEFRVNRDGGYLKAGAYSGLLLPQVAEERNWTAQEFLSALAQKAGVGEDVYHAPSTRLFVFRVQVSH